PNFQGGPAFLANLRMEQVLQVGEGRGADIVTGNFAGDSVRDLVFSAPFRDGGSGSAPISDTGGIFFFRGESQFPRGLQFLTSGQLGETYGTRLLRAADLK